MPTPTERCTLAIPTFSQGEEIGAGHVFLADGMVWSWTSRSCIAGTLKASPLVRVYPFGHPKPVEPAVNQNLCYGWHGLCELRENVSDDQHIFSATRLLQVQAR